MGAYAPTLLGLFGSNQVSGIAPAGQPRWIAVRERFKRFNENLVLTASQRADGFTKYFGVVDCLNLAYYGISNETAHSFLIGSWAKDTAVRPPRDVDLYFVLPLSVYERFQKYALGRQSALLQEVKNKLAGKYPATVMKGDGQIVLVGFGSYAVEVVPAFNFGSGAYLICDTNNGGSYKRTEPGAEAVSVQRINEACAGNLRPLIRMLKAWQQECSVPIKSFHLELLASNFLQTYENRMQDWFWFDWLIRDFFAYLKRQANGWVFAPGTNEMMFLGQAWYSKAESAHGRAIKACEYEGDNMVGYAGDEWQKIFGLFIARSV